MMGVEVPASLAQYTKLQQLSTDLQSFSQIFRKNLSNLF
mgnify:CR=1 FL=1